MQKTLGPDGRCGPKRRCYLAKPCNVDGDCGADYVCRFPGLIQAKKKILQKVNNMKRQQRLNQVIPRHKRRKNAIEKRGESQNRDMMRRRPINQLNALKKRKPFRGNNDGYSEEHCKLCNWVYKILKNI